MPQLESLRETARRLAARVEPQRGVRQQFRICAPPMGGKSLLLGFIAEELRQAGTFVPVHLAPPERELDAGPVALLQGQDCLRSAGIDLEGLSPGAPWQEQVQAFGAAVDQPGVVFLCDEPERWLAPQEPYFADCIRRLRTLIFHALSHPLIIAGDYRKDEDTTEPERPLLGGDAADWLKDAEAWGAFARFADRALAAVAEQLLDAPPLMVCLWVGLFALHEETGQPGEPTASTLDPARALIETLRATQHPVGPFWGRLSLIRRDLDHGLLERIGFSSLDSFSRAFVQTCLLYHHQGRAYLHPLLRRLGRALLDDPRPTHRLLGRYYGEGPLASRADEAEAFHHAAHSGDEEILQSCSHALVPQLNLLGRILSWDHHDYSGAVAVFERVLERDPKNDYARHYLAYNLDCQAREPGRIEENYRYALRVNPTPPRWHAHWIGYLITRARMTEAQAAWSYAVRMVGPGPDTWQHLHRPVALNLLVRGELDFAEQVLGSIPPRAVEEHPELRALRQRLDALKEVRLQGAFVPANILVAERAWWRHPHLLRDRWMGKRLTRWFSARVEAVDEERVTLRATDHVPGQEGFPPILSVELSPAQVAHLGWDLEDLRSCEFLELGFYSNGADAPDLHGLLFRSEPQVDPDLPRLFPPPDRYLQAFARGQLGDS